MSSSIFPCKVSGAVVGKGFRFGYKQAGNAERLKDLGISAGLKVCVSELVGAAAPGVVGNVSLALYPFTLPQSPTKN